MRKIEPTPPVKKIFVVLDPLRLVQPALEKAEWIAKRNAAELELYCAVYDATAPDDAAMQNALVERTRAWVERLAEPDRAAGLGVSVRVETAADWRHAVAAAAAASEADLVVKTASHHGPLRRRLMETSDWVLLRNCARPVLLATPNQIDNPRVVLAAVKVNPDDPVYQNLNERVIAWSHRIAQVLEAELHAVTVYRGEGVFFDRQRFADACGLPRNRVHATEGASHEGIAEVAREIGAGAIIVGSARRPAAGTVIGATAERVIDEVRADVVVLPAA